RKGPRPSLSDRTIESLANVPATPRDRRRSSFFTPQSPMTTGPQSRPGSSMSNARRPGSSDSSTSQMRNATITSRAFGAARPTSPIKRAPTSSTTTSTIGAAEKTHARTTSRANARVPLSGSKTMHARTPSSRPGLDGLFSSKPRPTRSTVASAARAVKPPPDAPDTSPRKVSSSSAALREQIRLAKEKHRRESAKGVEEEPNFDMVADPFNQKPRDAESEVSKRIAEARIEGRLNVSAMGLKEMPSEVLHMYDMKGDAADSVAWGEFVDIVKLTAADNELQTLPEEMFPDGEDDDKIPQFGGLENIDLHGNMLQTIPLGFRGLERLTILNLSRNKVAADCLEVIAQIPSLRELRLSENGLQGTLSPAISSMQNLEILELQGNKLSQLPDTLGELVKLRVLNVSANVLQSLPTESLSQLPLVELLASKNKLSGALLPSTVTVMSRIQRIEVSNNQLTALSDANTLSLPALKDLDISINRMSSLPDMSTWTNLGTFIAEDNIFSACPPGFTSLESLRTVNFTGNDFSRLDPEIGRMDGLVSFQIAANPIRESKFLSMNTEQLKASLKARLAAPAIV
ncbi:L domain-like protein, partial [Rhizodiscina lignyota]